jgi:2-polyprenyl-3-methyl-5-hydroxy-6-metoxy-1,4-benzoquinol methylase
VTQTASQRYQSEAEFFDAVAARSAVRPISPSVIDRYRRHRKAHLFAKEFLFSLAGDLAGRRVLEVGCGEGATSVQLALLGADVTGLDLSATSLERGRQLAALHGVAVEFRRANVETDDLPPGPFDVVWCDNILHHVVPALPDVIHKLKRALRPGGLFLAREPLQYVRWLKWLRRFVPVRVDATPDEQPLRRRELDILRDAFADLRCRPFRIVGRLDRAVASHWVLARCAQLDNALLRVPGAHRLAGHAVLWGHA